MAQRKIKADELPGFTPGEIVGAINTGAVIVNATLPVLTELAGRIIAWVKTLQTDALSTARGKRKAIEALQEATSALQALEKIDQQKQELYDKYFAQLIASGLVKA